MEDQNKNNIVPVLFQEGGVLAPLLRLPGAVLAGGALRDTYLGEKPKDYDIFFTKEALGDVEESKLPSCVLCERFLQSLGFEQIAETHYTKTFRKDLNQDSFAPPTVSNVIEVQIIFRDYYDDKKSIIDRFDFTNVMMAVDANGIEVGEEAFEDNDDKYVGINNPTIPLESLVRLKKYALKDWDVDYAYDKLVGTLNGLSADQAFGIAPTYVASFYAGRSRE